MRHSRVLAGVLALAAGGALAQGTETPPLSAIDWLGQAQTTPQPAAQPIAEPLSEPPVAKSGTVPDVTVTPLDGATPTRLGLLPFAVTGLPPQLWTGATADALTFALKTATDQNIPAAQDLVLMLLLAEADPPAGTGSLWMQARLDALLGLGAVEPALALVQQADTTRDKALFARWMRAALLTKQEAAPCASLVSAPQLAPDDATRIYCVARNGDFDTAALLYGTASALDALPSETEVLLARFLDPDLFEDAPLPRAPVRPDALTFRLFEAAGQPLPTAPLPRAFAHTDLSSDAGWKAQLEAAERLARVQVLPSNRLLGLYTERRAAASGGIWDRVQALQDFDRALTAGSAEDVAETLPAMWRGMRAARLEVVFSDLYAEQLTAMSLTGPAGEIAYRMALLSRGYETAPLPEGAPPELSFLASVAKGTPNARGAPTAMGVAVAEAFAPGAPVSEGLGTLAPGEIGLALLTVLGTLSDAGRGDLDALRRGLSDLRAMGLEDTARRVALQQLILRDGPG